MDIIGLKVGGLIRTRVIKHLYEWIADSSEDWLIYLTTLAYKIVYDGWECSDPSAVPVFCGDPPFSDVRERLKHEKLKKEKGNFT